MQPEIFGSSNLRSHVCVLGSKMALLTDKTRELLANRPRHITYRTIADDTSQSLPKSDQIEPDWLRRFAAGLAKQPSCDRVQILYEYLTGGPLIQ